ncbi:MAG: helix-turn-helix transcriptional regulator [Sulfitobacter sp.]
MTQSTILIVEHLLMHRENEVSGADIFRATGIASGTLYPILHRLEKQGWVKSMMEDIDPSAEGRPRKRLYTITGEGQKTALDKLNARTPRPITLSGVTENGEALWNT